VVGYTQSYGAGNNDILILKFGSDGSLTWARTAGDTGIDQAYDVIQSSDNKYYVVGETRNYSAVGYDALLLKFQSDGTLLWATMVGGSGDDHGAGVAEGQDGYIYVSGWTDSDGAGEDDAMLLKFSISGTYLWARIAGGLELDTAESIAVAADGGLVMAGRTESYGAGWWDTLLLKYTTSGNLTWARTFGGTDDEFYPDISRAADGGFVVTSYTKSYRESTLHDIFLIKTNLDGEIPNCPVCSTASPTTGTPTFSSSTPAVTLATETVTTSSVSPTVNSPSVSSYFVCGFPFDLYLPIVIK
jgi:hypothetical protein